QAGHWTSPCHFDNGCRSQPFLRPAAPSLPAMLTISNLTYRIQGRVLLDGASLVLPAGSKAGLVGKNGSGKTTLFNLIMGRLSVDGGSIEVHPKARVGTVAQEAPGNELTPLEVVLAAD